MIVLTISMSPASDRRAMLHYCHVIVICARVQGCRVQGCRVLLVDVVGCVVLGAAVLVVLGGEVSTLCQCV